MNLPNISRFHTSQTGCLNNRIRMGESYVQLHRFIVAVGFNDTHVLFIFSCNLFVLLIIKVI
jgi:hypothetical protein